MNAPYRYRARTSFYVGAVAFFILIASTAVLFARGYTFDFSTGIVSRNGLLVVGSTPNGANIYINDKQRSERTDTRIKLKPGAYNVRIEKPDYVPYTKRYEVTSGQAILNEDILLFLKEPVRREIAPSGVTNVTMAPDDRTFAYLRRTAAGSELWTASLSNDTPPKRIAIVPPDLAALSVFSFGADSDRLLLATANQAIVYTGAGQVVSRLQLPAVQSFAGNRTDAVLTNPGGRLTLVSLGDGRQEVLEENVTTWGVSSVAVYVAQGQTLIRRDLRGPRSSFIAPAKITSIFAAPRTDQPYFLTNDRRLFTTTSNQVLPIANEVDRWHASGDGTAVGLIGGGELRIWYRDTGRTTLVTRFSTPANEILTMERGRYALYSREGELHAVAADGSNDTTLGAIGSALLVNDVPQQLRFDQATGSLTALTFLKR